MGFTVGLLKHLFHAGALAALLGGMAAAQDADTTADPDAPMVGAEQTGDAELAELYAELADPDLENWEPVENRIITAWMESGSAAMDLLLRRGHQALEDGDLPAAINHLTALTDHAPEFAEGWNARATAFFLADMLGQSVQDIRRTLALNPKHFGALTGLGQIFERLDRPKDALAAYEAAFAIHPHRPDLKQAMERLEIEIGGVDL